MKNDMIRLTNYFELELFNNANNRIATLNHVAPLIPGLMASIRDKLNRVEGEISPESESETGALIADIAQSLNDAFNSVDLVEKKLHDWFEQVTALELKEPEPIFDDTTAEPPIEDTTAEPPIEDTTSAEDVTSTDPIYNDITDNPPNYGDSADIIIPAED